MLNRINYIDICKGLLIIIVIMVHIPNYARTWCVSLSQNFSLIDYILQFIFACFIMQAFFILSGYTANFNKPFHSYFINLCKRILVPKFTLTIIWRIGDWILADRHTLMTEMYGENYFFLFECYWFLDALFIIKLVQYFLCKYIKNDIAHGFFWFIMLIMNIYINNYIYGDAKEPGHYLNYFHYRNAMGMGLYMWIGYYYKKHITSEKIIYILGFLFIPLIIYPYFTGIFEPVQYSHSTSITLIQIPKHILFSICGSCAIISFSKLISKSFILEYLGRNSLIIYCLHFPFLTYILIFINHISIPLNTKFTILIFVIILISSLFLCIISIQILNAKKIKWIIGKF